MGVGAEISREPRRGGIKEKKEKERIEGLLSILFLETKPTGIRKQGRVFIKHNKRPLCSHVCAEQMSGGVLGRIT